MRLLSSVCTSRRPGRGGGEKGRFQTTMGEVCEKISCLSAVWRSSNVLMCVFFTLASYVQINDPDAGLWMVGYAVPAVLCAVIGFRPHVTETLAWRRVADLHLMVSSAAIFMLGWKLYAQRATQIFQQEEGREFSGLMLTAVWLLLCRRSGSAPVGKLRVSTAVAITVFPIVSWLYYHVNKDLRSDWPSHCKTAI